MKESLSYPNINSVSNEIRDSIEEELLMPIVEIEKRKREKVEDID